MPPKPSSVTTLSLPGNEARARELEDRAEQRQHGIAGQETPDVSTRKRTPNANVQKATADVQQDTRKGVVNRRNGRKRRRRTIYIPLDLDQRFGDFCNKHGREASETVAAALELYLDHRER